MHLTLELLAAKLTNKAVRVFCDNQTAVAVLRSMYTKSRSLRTVLANIVRVCRGHTISLIPTYIASAANELADALSSTLGTQHAHVSNGFMDLL